jgi:hypothetical protein
VPHDEDRPSFPIYPAQQPESAAESVLRLLLGCGTEERLHRHNRQSSPTRMPTLRVVLVMEHLPLFGRQTYPRFAVKRVPNETLTTDCLGKLPGHI